MYTSLPGSVRSSRRRPDHNIHHASELSDLADQLTGEARHQMLHAVESFDQANGYLSAALELLEKKDQD